MHVHMCVQRRFREVLILEDSVLLPQVSIANHRKLLQVFICGGGGGGGGCCPLSADSTSGGGGGGGSVRCRPIQPVVGGGGGGGLFAVGRFN